MVRRRLSRPDLVVDGGVVGTGSLGSPGAAWAIEGVADFNPDGKADIP